MAHTAEAHAEPVPTEPLPYSWRIPPGLVAAVAILLGAGALIRLDLAAEAFVAAVFCAVLVVLAAIDLERHVIPNVIVLPAAGVVLAGNIAADIGDAWQYVIAAGLAFLGGALASLATRGGIGMGDAKLCLLLGAGLGWTVLGALLVGSLAAAAVGIVILLRHGSAARKRMIPFGPFLAFGGTLVLFL